MSHLNLKLSLNQTQTIRTIKIQKFASRSQVQTKLITNKNFANYLSSDIWYAFEQKRVEPARLEEHIRSEEF